MTKIKLGTIGNSLVGKTSICRKYIGEEFSTEEIGTVGCEKYEKFIEYTRNEKTIKINILIYDTAGHERYEATIFNYIKKCDGIILVYAINDQKTFDDISKWVKKIKELQYNKNVPVVLIGNKIDLDNQRVVKLNYGENLKKLIVNFLKLSTKDNINVEQVFETILF
jgi:small GTP-binding protein